MDKINKQQFISQDKLTEFLLYESSNGEIKIDVLLQNETIWLPQKHISELFGVDRSVITKHIKNIFDTEELTEKSNVQKMHISHSDTSHLEAEIDKLVYKLYNLTDDEINIAEGK